MISEKTKVNLAKYTYFLFIISLFFPLRKVFFSNSAYLTGAYSDFTSFSLYLSDILILTTWGLVLISRGGAREMAHHVVKNIKWLIFWLILAILWHFKENSGLNWYFLLKYAELIVAYETTVYIFSNFSVKQQFFKIFLLFSTIESLLALIQFWLQKSIGIKLLGETLLSPHILGVAKIVSGGTRYIRGYGTFPHPNLLAAFLLVSVLLLIFFIQRSETKKSIITYLILLFINILGLTVTFSRGAFLAFGIGLLVYFGSLIIKSFNNEAHITLKQLRLTIFTLITSIILAFIIFWPFILTRATFSDQALIDRKEYNQIGIQMIKDKPIFGWGIGESVLHMEQYSKTRLESWQKQPIHNYFLLSAAELGIPGALTLLWIFLSHLWGLIKKIKKGFSPILYSLIAILVSALVLMLFDHYFYTLQQTQMLLWISLGIISAETHKKIPEKGDSPTT